MTSQGTKEGGANRPWDAISADFVGAIGVGSDPQSLPLSSVEIAFAGRSNVGKSSLINALVRRRGLVRTSNTPGCTRQINFFSVACRDGARSVFVDLPGYGFAKRSKAEKQQWAELIEGYLAKRTSLAAVVLLVDARRGVEEEELALLQFIAEHRPKPPMPVVLVATKFDKVERSRSKVVRDELRRRAGVPVVAFSTVDKLGYDELWKAIRKATGVGEPRSDDAGVPDSSVPATKPA